MPTKLCASFGLTLALLVSFHADGQSASDEKRPPVVFPIASRAAMLISTVAAASKPEIKNGNAVWSIVPAPAGHPAAAIGVKSEVDIPDLKMHALMILRKNFDASLPASHTIDLRVSFDAGSTVKGIKDIALPLMRRDDPPAADALIGVRVKISDNYFLIGLNRGDADIQRNVQDIAERSWFDFPMQLEDNRIGKLTFEKGADGNRIVAAALAAWNTEQRTGRSDPFVTVVGKTDSPNKMGRLEIALEPQGGVLKVPVLVNGKLALDFTVDSGASDVTVPADVVSTLRRTGTLTDADFIGHQTFILADGSKFPGQTFRIRSLKVGDKIVENVIGSTIKTEGQLLLGQSFLSRFRSWSIDNSRRILILESVAPDTVAALAVNTAQIAHGPDHVTTSNATYAIRRSGASGWCLFRSESQISCLQSPAVWFGAPAQTKDYNVIPIFNSCSGPRCYNSNYGFQLLVEDKDTATLHSDFGYNDGIDPELLVPHIDVAENQVSYILEDASTKRSIVVEFRAGRINIFR